MKFTIGKNILLENLSNVVKAISTKNIIPILNGVKFELNEEGLFLTASDSELTIRAFIEKKAITNVENEGSIIIQSKYILDIIRKMPSDLINFELMDGLKIKISSDNSQYDLNCLDSKEYPSLKLEETNKKAKEYEEKLQSNEETRELVEQHLEECEKCRNLYQGILRR